MPKCAQCGREYDLMRRTVSAVDKARDEVYKAEFCSDECDAAFFKDAEGADDFVAFLRGRVEAGTKT